MCPSPIAQISAAGAPAALAILVPESPVIGGFDRGKVIICVCVCVCVHRHHFTRLTRTAQYPLLVQVPVTATDQSHFPFHKSVLSVVNLMTSLKPPLTVLPFDALAYLLSKLA